MAELKVDLAMRGTVTGPKLFVTIDGRQALQEGPRRVGHCVYCAGQCQGVTNSCEHRVWVESTHPWKIYK